MTEQFENQFKKIRINYEASLENFLENKEKFPKYTTQLINLANQNSGGTKPKIVGKMTELIKECPYKTREGWEKWYISKYPTKIDDATEKILPMVNNLKNAIELIDKKMVKTWVEDLIFNKTPEGLIIQEIILNEISKRLQTSYRMATKEEESKNIDGYIGEIPVQIKPDTYLAQKPIVKEKINISIIYYNYKKSNKYLTIITDIIR
ncbi:MjaI family restriction endonuclease [Methanospirillum sp.]|uniref:MjaI family restriction endonuclease n=1 Tax=Methanospirillum sp. TaxID=45200 RepID=UPI0035A01438